MSVCDIMFVIVTSGGGGDDDGESIVIQQDRASVAIVQPFVG